MDQLWKINHLRPIDPFSMVNHPTVTVVVPIHHPPSMDPQVVDEVLRADLRRRQLLQQEASAGGEG